MSENKHSDDEIKVGSLLMRLYHSRQMGEEFYHANLVNGEAPKLEAFGFIERYGDGWRLTDDGMQAWAEMNVHSFNSKYHYQGPFYAALRELLLSKGEESMTGICKKEGCDQPRHVSIGGSEFSYCHEHQKEQWAAAKRDQTAKEKPEKPPRPRATQPPKKIEVVTATLPTINTVVEVEPAQVAEQFQHVVEALTPIQHDCQQCTAKTTIEALRAKSPKLAKLIDAMQAEVEAAAELGI